MVVAAKCLDTIFALASGALPCGIAIIRVSGPKSLEIFERITGSPPKSPRLLTYHRFRHPKSREIIDHGLAVYFRGPNSYTGEDSFEVHCHGGEAVVRAMYRSFSYCNARVAEKGEFTKRAVLNGRIDLSQAEAVRALIEATDDYEAKRALKCLSGQLRDQVRQWRQDLLDCLVEINAKIDFGEDHSSDGAIESSSVLLNRLKSVYHNLSQFVGHSSLKRKMKYGPKLVIVGEANVGKSSLLNVLANEDVAIVSEMAGTTRDTIQIHLDNLSSISVNVIDTAGIRDCVKDQIETEGMRRSIEKAREADAVICVVDATTSLIRNEKDLSEYLGNLLNGFSPDLEKVFVVVNKIDLTHASNDQEKPNGIAFNYVSCLTRQNLDNLKSKLGEFINSRFGDDGKSCEESIFVDERQVNAAKRALDEIGKALAPNVDCLCQAAHVERALNELSQISADLNLSSDDVLDEIFKKFCVGK